MMKLFCLTLSLSIALCHGRGYRSASQLNVVAYSWKLLEFGFPSQQAKEQAIASGNFVPTRAAPIDVQPYYGRNGRRVFVTIPKLGVGVPYSLAEVSQEKGPNGAVLRPYPNYEMHNIKGGSNCNAITSAFRVAIDKCDRLWVIDSGRDNKGAQCAPQILVFDLATDDLIYRHRFSQSVYIPRASMLNNIALSGSCEDVMAYVSDVKYHGLIVHDFRHNESWRIEDPSMYPEPSHGLITLAGESFVLMDGIFAIATDNKNLYYHALASRTEYAVPLQLINNSSFAKNIRSTSVNEAFKRLGVRQSNCAASAIDDRGNWYCVTVNPIRLLQWNVNTPFRGRYIKYLPINEKHLEFVAGMKVVKNNLGQNELWMMSNRDQKLASRTLNYNETNFRIVVHSLKY